MRLSAAAAIFGALVFVPQARGQSAVRIYTEPAGATFYVDGQGFQTSANFQWPANSKHTVTAPSQEQALFNTQLVFKGWVTNLTQSAPSFSQPITASPGLQWIKLVFETAYLVRISLVDCPNRSQPCPVAGWVEIVETGITYDRSTDLFFPKGATVTVRALPNTGYIFEGWAQVAGSVGRPSEFEFGRVLSEPWLLAPQFQPANAVNVAVNIETIPPRMRILADQTPYSPPIGPGQTVSLEWGWGTTHTIGTDRVQIENGVTYVFDSWSDGGAINHEITVPRQAGALSFTAKFVPAVFTTFATAPAGLKLTIDGGPNFPESGIAWAAGTTHKIAAPATQTDAQGRKYRFVSWSNGKAAAFDYTVGAANERLTATYQAVGQLTVESVPAGLPLEVDGKSCVSPCSIEKDAGQTASVSVPGLRSLGDDSRLVFQSWGDSRDTSRQIALATDPTRYVATYLVQHRLRVASSPAEGASFSMNPASPDGFYDAGSLVAIGFQLGVGFRYAGWSGDFSGNSGGAVLAMDRPRRGVLMLDRVPAIGAAGVRNAAGTSADGVTAGSLISIYGANLAPDVAVSQATPLPQALASVTVRVGDTFLPLVLVSPGQINAQLPSNLAEGTARLTLRWEGKPEAVAPIAVVRNSPGLFTGGSAEQPMGSFVRAGGEQISTANGARLGETVSLLGTGFGPYRVTPPDGFVFDELAGYSLIDPVTVIAGDREIDEILYAGRSGAGVGVDAVQFRVPSSLPDGPYLPVKIRIQGRESNTVLLPIRH